jgi:hypothetical protein
MVKMWYAIMQGAKKDMSEYQRFLNKKKIKATLDYSHSATGIKVWVLLVSNPKKAVKALNDWYGFDMTVISVKWAK